VLAVRASISLRIPGRTSGPEPHGACVLVVVEDRLEVFSATERVVTLRRVASGQHEPVGDPEFGDAPRQVVRQLLVRGHQDTSPIRDKT